MGAYREQTAGEAVLAEARPVASPYGQEQEEAAHERRRRLSRRPSEGVAKPRRCTIATRLGSLAR